MKKTGFLSAAVICFFLFAYNQAQPQIAGSASLKWNWDTIVTTNTTGPYQRLTQQFNNKGYALLEFTETWQSNAWVAGYKTSYAYDTGDNLLSEMYEAWQANTWVVTGRKTNTYDTSGFWLTQLYERWENNTWTNIWITYFTNDSSGRPLVQLNQNWQANAWEISDRIIRTYDSSGHELTRIFETWQANAWVNNIRFTNTYDANGFRVYTLDEEWQNNAWEIRSKYTYANDVNGNILSKLRQLWQGGAWVDTTKTTHTYDANNNSLTGKFEVWKVSGWKSGIGLLYFYCPNSITEYVFNIYTYAAHYISFVTGIENTTASAASLSLFPNPARETITVSCPAYLVGTHGWISIYSLQGQLLLQQPLLLKRTDVPIGMLSTGIYQVVVNNGEKTVLAKFIKE